MPKVKIAIKILFGFLVMCLMMSAVAVFSIWGQTVIVESYTEITDMRAPLTEIVLRIRAEMLSQSAATQSYALSRDEGMVEVFSRSQTEVNKLVEQAEKMVETEESKKFLSLIQGYQSDYKDYFERVLNLVEIDGDDEDTDDAATVVEAEGEEAQTDDAEAMAVEVSAQGAQLNYNVEKVTNDWIKFIDKENEMFKEKVRQADSRSRTITVGSTIVAVIVSVFLALLISQTISASIGKLTVVAEQISHGDLTAIIEVPDTGDEVQKLAESFSQALGSLRSLISKTGETASRVAAASEELTANAEQTSSATGQIAKAIEGVARGTSEQTKNIADAADLTVKLKEGIANVTERTQDLQKRVRESNEAISRMAAATRSINQIGEDVSKHSYQTMAAAESGGKAVKQTVEGMQRIDEAARIANMRISELAEHNAKINEIVQVISDIADQTNLLALNAAIEAARAGEHGKGFAVVAEEVRKLAEISSHATKEIGALIANIEKASDNAVAAMGDATSEVNKGTELAANTGTVLQNIIDTMGHNLTEIEGILEQVELMHKESDLVVLATKEVEDSVDSILKTTEEMLAASMTTSDAMTNIASISEENAAASEEVSASVEEMSASSEEIANSSEELANMAQDLRACIEGFTV
jgi:methyl-accepting chemotaxis protein